MSVLLAALLAAAPDAGASLTPASWREHPRIVEVRERVGEIDARTAPARHAFFCAVRSSRPAPSTLADWQRLRRELLHEPDFETVDAASAVRDDVEVTRYLRAGKPLFLLYRESSTNVGAYRLEVRVYYDADGQPFWWATRYEAGGGPYLRRIEAAGARLPALPDGTTTPQVNLDGLARWTKPETATARLRPCSAEAARRVLAVADGSDVANASDLANLIAAWTVVKDR